MNILWAGPTADEGRAGAASPAAGWWTGRLLSTMRTLGVKITALTHVPHPLWPRGPVRISGTESHLGYWNLPGLRTKSLASSYSRAARHQLRDVDHLITYNPYGHHLQLGRQAQAMGVPWTCVFADDVASSHSHPGGSPHAVGTCDLAVFLSWHSYRRHNKAPSLHLDGGVDNVDFETTRMGLTATPTILYSGALTPSAGVDLLIESIPYMSVTAEVWIFGKGNTDWLWKLSQRLGVSDRIKIRGFVEPSELHEYSLRAWSFANPRPLDSSSLENFPSKILRYLSYNKPIASTPCGGLSPDYEAMLEISDGASPMAFAECLDRSLAEPSSVERALSGHARMQFASTHSWPVQVGRLLEALDDVSVPRFK